MRLDKLTKRLGELKENPNNRNRALRIARDLGDELPANNWSTLRAFRSEAAGLNITLDGDSDFLRGVLSALTAVAEAYERKSISLIDEVKMWNLLKTKSCATDVLQKLLKLRKACPNELEQVLPYCRETITRNLTSLRGLDLVKAETSESDRRVRNYQLTSHGLSVALSLQDSADNSSEKGDGQQECDEWTPSASPWIREFPNTSEQSVLDLPNEKPYAAYDHVERELEDAEKKAEEEQVLVGV